MQWNQKCCHFTIISYCYIIVYILLAHCFSSTMYFLFFRFCFAMWYGTPSACIWIRIHFCHPSILMYEIWPSLSWEERVCSAEWFAKRFSPNSSSSEWTWLCLLCYAWQSALFFFFFCGLHSFIWLATKCDDDSCCYCFFFWFGLVSVVIVVVELAAQ